MIKPKTISILAGLGFALFLLGQRAASQIPQESRIGNLIGRSDGGGIVHPDRGKQLYGRYCVGCHGAQGDGNGENGSWIDPKPRDFTAGVFKCRSTPTGNLPTDQDVFNTITRGLVNTNMPSWVALTKQNRADLVAYVKIFSPRWKNEQAGAPIAIPPEPTVTIAAILHGREVYQKVECWKCHGPEGRGDGPSASSLTDSKNNPIRPYNFSASSRFKCGDSNADLYRILMTGLDGTPMPSFSDVVQPGDAWDLVHFLRTLQPMHSPESSVWRKWLSSHAGELKAIGPEGTSQ